MFTFTSSFLFLLYLFILDFFNCTLILLLDLFRLVLILAILSLQVNLSVNNYLVLCLTEDCKENHLLFFLLVNSHFRLWLMSEDDFYFCFLLIYFVSLFYMYIHVVFCLIRFTYCWNLLSK